MKPIRTQADYEAALARIDGLMSASEGSPEADDLETLAILVEKFEEQHWPMPDAPAFEVLRLVMEGKGLTPKDMTRYLGSPSTVSKVLHGKKELTVNQIRVLSRELGIPGGVLIGAAPDSVQEVDWISFPLIEMARRGLFGREYIRSRLNTLSKAAADLVPGLIGQAGLDHAKLPRLRQGLVVCPASDPYAVMAWLLEVAKVAQDRLPAAQYKGLTREDMQALAAMSRTLDGIRRAMDYLEERGVLVVIVPHYKKSRIDGGVVFLDGGRPTIGLSLRYDRVDYFWFTLLHEVAHIVCGHVEGFLADDSLEPASHDAVEQEANALVEEVTVPAAEFDTAIPDPREASLEAVIELAQSCGVSVALVAGRVQYKSGNYRKFARLLGRGKVRRLFEEEGSEKKQ